MCVYVYVYVCARGKVSLAQLDTMMFQIYLQTICRFQYHTRSHLTSFVAKTNTNQSRQHNWRDTQLQFTDD